MSHTHPAGTTAAHPATTTGLSRRADLSVWVLQILLALFLAVPSAGPKLVGHSSATAVFDQIGLGDGFMYLVGALELAGAIGLVVPLLSGVAALALIGLMAGAFATQLTVFDGRNALTPVIFAVLFAVVAWARRHRTAQLLALLRRRPA